MLSFKIVLFVVILKVFNLDFILFKSSAQDNNFSDSIKIFSSEVV